MRIEEKLHYGINQAHLNTNGERGSQPYGNVLVLSSSDSGYFVVAYQEIIGCLMYSMVGTCRGNGHAVCRPARFVEKPTAMPVQAIKRVMHNWTRSKDYVYKYSANKNVDFSGYVDLNYAVDLLKQKYTSGFVFDMAGGWVSWCSRIQEMIALSSTEGEYLSLTTGVKNDILSNGFLSSLEIDTRLCID